MYCNPERKIGEPLLVIGCVQTGQISGCQIKNHLPVTLLEIYNCKVADFKKGYWQVNLYWS